MSNYLDVPVNSRVSTPTQAGLAAGTGTIDVRLEAASNSWADGSTFPMLVDQQNRFAFYFLSSGELEFDMFHLGGGASFATSTVPTGLGAGVRKWVRAVRNIAAGTCDFYTSPDGSSWTSLGSQITGLSTTTEDTGGGSPVSIGDAVGGGDPFVGKVYTTIVIVNAATILNMDWTTATTGAGPWVAGTGETWTSAAGTASVISVGASIVPASTGVSFGASGSITAPSKITPATAGVAFGASGSITAPTRIAPATGGVVFGASGSITAPVRLTPSTSGVVFGATGSITAPTAIAPASSGVVFSGTGSISAASVPFISGTAGVSFSGAGSLTAPTRVVFSTSGVSFSGSGAVTAPTSIMATATGVSFGPSVAFTAPTRIAASSSVSFAATGSISATPRVAAAGSVVFAGAGSISVPIVLMTVVIRGAHATLAPIHTRQTVLTEKNTRRATLT